MQLMFEPTLEGEAVLRDCLNEPGGFGGWRRPPVWFDMDATQPRALVMFSLLDESPESPAVIAWVDRRSEAGCEHEVTFMPAVGCAFPFGQLSLLPALERYHQRRRHRDDPLRSMGLGVRDGKAAVGGAAQSTAL